MAIDEHSISRRVVIGALAVTPAIATVSVVEAAATGGVLPAAIAGNPSGTRWKAVIGKYRRLRAEWVAHPYGRTRPGSPDYRRLEQEEGVIAGRVSRAFKAMLRTAPPDNAALAEKLELFDEELGDVLDGELAYLVRDARRLIRPPT